MPRIALGIEYNGRNYCGWQWQPGKPSIQAALQQALAKVADQPVEVVCAGRTDAGVHALEQVVHFESLVARRLDSWLLGGNTHLPEDVRILWAKPVSDAFHARYSALARWYRYVIFNRPVKSALSVNLATWWYQPLDAEVMDKAAQVLVGHHDFSSFRAQGCQSKSPFRQLHFINVTRSGETVQIDICANAFLHHMVRNITGALLEIGSGKRQPDWLVELLELKQRIRAGITAPPDGLYLASVYYPAAFGFSVHPIFSKLPSDVRRFDCMCKSPWQFGK
jgi:tRNA pseudouridine38-40 synthase